MGYLTPVLIYNDSMHEFVKDPNINQEIRKASFEAERSQKWGCPEDAFYQTFKKTKFDKFLAFFGLQRITPKRTLKTMGGSGSCALVLRPQHADVNRVIVVTGNGFMDLTDVIFHKDELSDYEKSALKVVENTISYYKKSQKMLKKET